MHILYFSSLSNNIVWDWTPPEVFTVQGSQVELGPGQGDHLDGADLQDVVVTEHHHRAAHCGEVDPQCLLLHHQVELDLVIVDTCEQG